MFNPVCVSVYVCLLPCLYHPAPSASVTLFAVDWVLCCVCVFIQCFIRFSPSQRLPQPQRVVSVFVRILCVRCFKTINYAAAARCCAFENMFFRYFVFFYFTCLFVFFPILFCAFLLVRFDSFFFVNIIERIMFFVVFLRLF